MFGYVRPDRTELLVKDDAFYRAVYCGICRSMKAHTGIVSPVFLTYDSVFLAMVRMLYVEDADIRSKRIRCVAHPLKKRLAVTDNEALSYTAGAFACLSFYKAKDAVDDERFFASLGARMAMPFLSHGIRLADLSPLEEKIRTDLLAIRQKEEEKCDSVDVPADLFGRLLRSVFSYGLCDDAALVTGEVGYHLGKFIYAADAAEDYAKDASLDAYNPFVISHGGKPLSSSDKESIYTGLLLEAEAMSRAVELLPFGSRKTLERIIKNITYLGLEKRVRFLKEETP